MNKISLIAVSMLLGNTAYASGDDVSFTEEAVNTPSPWSFKASLEERYRPTQKNNSGAIHQTVFRFDGGYTINDNMGLFGALWLRDRQQDGYTNNEDWITAVDMFIGGYYEVNTYLSPYVFWETYRDMELYNDKGWSAFGAVGVSGTLYSEGKHSVSYYTEYYFALGVQSGPYEGAFDNFDEYGSETAIKYSYAAYEKVSVYFQPTWYVYGDGGLDSGNIEYRAGISVSF